MKRSITKTISAIQQIEVSETLLDESYVLLKGQGFIYSWISMKLCMSNFGQSAHRQLLSSTAPLSSGYPSSWLLQFGEANHYNLLHVVTPLNYSSG